MENHPIAFRLTSFIAVVAALTSGCGTARFYTQAIEGQAQILTGAKPIEPLLASETTDPLVKQRLTVIRDLREFASSELALDPGNAYLRYIDLERPFVVWNVYATPQFSLEDKTWWYPIIGSASYRGFFREEYAKDLARSLRREGFDVHTGGVEAYSTLGWFADPVFNTMIDDESPTDIAATLFHELAHRRLYVRGDSEFNEAFATAVEQVGVRRWLEARGDLSAIAGYEAELANRRHFVELVAQTRDQLAGIYSTREFTRHEMQTAKDAAIADFQRTLKRYRDAAPDSFGYRSWIEGEVNNARLNTVDTYHALVPGFLQLLEESDGDLAEFYLRVESLRPLAKEQRRAVLATD